MKNATLAVGLKSGDEDWFSQSTVAGVSQPRLREVAFWIFEEGCRRLGAGGEERLRSFEVTMTAHYELMRVADETVEIESRFRPLDAREILEHLFAEAARLLWRHNDR